MSKTKILSKKEIKNRLSTRTYEKYIKVINNNALFNDEELIEITKMIKTYAKENNVRQFAHLFFPLSTKISCKYTSFNIVENDEIIFSLEPNELIKTEIDMSSITYSKDICNTKGYLYWDYYSSIFIKDKIMYIPCFFIDSKNNSLDLKYPLRKSTIYISSVCKKMCDLLSYKNVNNITPLSGLEIEYFLFSKEEINKKKYDNELHNFYFEDEINVESNYLNVINKNIRKYMDEVDKELLLLNIVAKVEHNEVAANQYELVLYYNDCNKTFEYNYLIMHILDEVAKKHNLVCLLNEKPFVQLNGSGKHNNYSLITDTKINLFNKSNFNIYIITIASLLKAINNNEALISLGVSSPSNSLRLGQKEAPSNIISISMSEDLISYFEGTEIKKDEESCFNLYAQSSIIIKDNCKRNRSSPICILNNKVEFRGLGSSMSEGLLNTILNTILGDAIESTIHEIEKELKDFPLEKAIKKVVTNIYNENKRIIYNDSCYEEDYIKYSINNNLLIFKNIDELVSHITKNKSYSVLLSHNIFNEEEMNKILNYLIEENNNYLIKEGKILLKTFKTIIIPSINNVLQTYLNNSNKSLIIKNKTKIIEEYIKNTYITLTNLEDIIYQQKGKLNTLPSIKEELLFQYKKIQFVL